MRNWVEEKVKGRGDKKNGEEKRQKWIGKRGDERKGLIGLGREEREWKKDKEIVGLVQKVSFWAVIK